MRITVCQINSQRQSLQRELEKLRVYVKEQGTDFLLLPEMGFSNWLAATRNPNSELWNNAVKDHETEISKLDSMGATAVMGTRPIVDECSSRRNEAYIWSTQTMAAIGLRQKYYLPDEEGYWEHSWYDRGPKSFDVGRVLDARVGVQICTEMWFFEWARHYAASQVDVLCIPRATPHGSTEKWLAGGQAAAVCSGAYCISSNLWAPEGESPNAGGLGWIIDPEGTVLATTTPKSPFATVDIDLEFSNCSKDTYPRYVSE